MSDVDDEKARVRSILNQVREYEGLISKKLEELKKLRQERLKSPFDPALLAYAAGWIHGRTEADGHVPLLGSFIEALDGRFREPVDMVALYEAALRGPPEGVL